MNRADAKVAAPVSAAATTLAATLSHLRRRTPRELLFVAVVCVAIAVLLTAISRGGFIDNLAYSFAIGLCCTLVTEGLRLAVAAAADAVRRWRGLPPQDTLLPGRMWVLIPLGLVGVWFGAPLGLQIGDWLTGQRSPQLWSLSSGSARFTLTISVLAMLVCIVVVAMLERLQRARADAETAQRQAAENQLRLLQSQLEPHMLFNTLANLRVLIGVDAERAQAMLDRLIQFLRGTLAASRMATQPLADEFGHTADYLALMAVRMGSRLAVRLELPEELKALPVPTLLLQPLVENAIKHGLEPKVEGGRIEVQAGREAGLLVLSVRDTGLGLAHSAALGSAGTSFGVAQVRERLATLYGAAASLTLEDAPGGVGALATIRLPLPVADTLPAETRTRTA